eukprot:6195241-Pleurochrysis_carterae.AAC.3
MARQLLCLLWLFQEGACQTIHRLEVDAQGRSMAAGPMDESWHPRGLSRRRLTTLRKQCGDAGAEARFGRTELTEPAGVISLYDAEHGYDGNLFCEWLIKPPGAQSVAIMFQKFQVACCASDFFRVIQLSCEASESPCLRRTQSVLLSFPASFADANRSPDPLVVSDASGHGVQLLLRFSSAAYSGAAGFVVGYSANVFDALAIAPQLVPDTMGTRLSVYGTGFKREDELRCRWSGSEDSFFLPAQLPEQGGRWALQNVGAEECDGLVPKGD